MDKKTLYLDRESTIRVLEQFHFKIIKNGANYFFALREEKTPSCLINKDGSVHDYGSGFHGSIYDVLDFTNKLPSGLSKAQALDYCRNLLYQKMSINHQYSDLKEANTIKEKPIDMSWYKNTFLNQELLQDNYLRLLQDTIKGINDIEVLKKIANKFYIGYSKQTQNDCERLVMPIIDIYGNISTLWRYNPNVEKDKRLRFVKGRKRSAFNLNAVKNTHAMVLICEGEKDVLNAYARGFIATTPGSASSRFRSDELEIFTDKVVLSIGDYDDSGIQFNLNNARDIAPKAKKFSIGRWDRKLEHRFLKKGFDVTDFFALQERKTA